MSDEMHTSEGREFGQERDSLWRITLGPLTWAVHFLLSYASAAVWCAKISALPGEMLGLRAGLGVATVLALAIIARLGWRSWRQWDFLDDYDYEHPEGAVEDRHEFLGHAAFLLCILSFVGVIFTALPLVFAGSCR